ncbi:hypothetical protein LOAG_02494 [Loa loa]|uniref:Uncharacterized protein n=1 Tax=Loa loa TaxID=7209 RepID=A0A1S0U6X9_LOALO|nr:hypothetical protein LOAG_02494 [Loa loa]EFO25993.2 hypothetical protein LOAG_02494 [Loa loa]
MFISCTRTLHERTLCIRRAYICHGNDIHVTSYIQRCTPITRASQTRQYMHITCTSDALSHADTRQMQVHHVRTRRIHVTCASHSLTLHMCHVEQLDCRKLIAVESNEYEMIASKIEYRRKKYGNIEETFFTNEP